MPIIKIPARKGYYADYIDAFGKRHRTSLKTDLKKVAEMKFAELLRRENLVKQTGVPNMSWEQFKQKFFAYIKVEKEPSTVARYKLAIKYLESIKYIKFLYEITPNLLQELKENLLNQKKGVAGVNRVVKAIKAMMHQAEKWELVPPKKWQNVSKLKEKKGRIDFYTDEEITQMLYFFPSWKLVILLGARAGLRRGEMANLKWQDIDFKNNQIYVAPNKTENYRYVPLSNQLKEALKNAQKQAKTPFVIDIKGDCPRTDRCYLSGAFSMLLKRHNIRGSLHTLRHTFASHLVQRGIDLYSVSKLLGHKSIKTTEIYAHLAPKTLHDAISKLK